VNFSYIYFALLLLLMGTAMGIFSSPNLAGIMNSLPPDQRGAGAGMLATFQNSAQVLSIGVFFTLIVLGLAHSLPHSLYNGLVAQGVPPSAAHRAASLPPVASLFAAFLGYNPIRTLLGSSLAGLPANRVDYLTGRGFFPHLISAPFASGLAEAFPLQWWPASSPPGRPGCEGANITTPGGTRPRSQARWVRRAHSAGSDRGRRGSRPSTTRRRQPGWPRNWRPGCEADRCRRSSPPAGSPQDLAA
jgi:hypothetical protein